MIAVGLVVYCRVAECDVVTNRMCLIRLQREYYSVLRSSTVRELVLESFKGDSTTDGVQQALSQDSGWLRTRVGPFRRTAEVTSASTATCTCQV
jgi:hypothetical protein